MRRGSRFSFRSRTGLARAACEIAFRAVETCALYAGGVAIPRLRRQGLSQNRPSIGFPGCCPIIATNITVSPVTQAMTLPMPSRCGEISGSALPYRVLRSVYRCTFGTPADLVFNQNLVCLGTPADLVWGMAGQRRSGFPQLVYLGTPADLVWRVASPSNDAVRRSIQHHEGASKLIQTFVRTPNRNWLGIPGLLIEIN